MTRENFYVKARRLLTEGRLYVRAVDADRVVAQCRGDGGEVYHLGYELRGWWCSCPALSRCSHLQALMLVVVRPGTTADVSTGRAS